VKTSFSIFFLQQSHSEAIMKLLENSLALMPSCQSNSGNIERVKYQLVRNSDCYRSAVESYFFPSCSSRIV
jgi:hypothetical protein